MLKISVVQLDNEGIDFTGTATSEMLNLDRLEVIHEDISFANPIEYKLHVSLVSGGILVAGTLNTSAQCPCGRCLEEFDLQLKNIEVCHFHENFKGTELDIAPELREDLLISLPMRFTCREDCPGIKYESSKTATEKKAEEELDSDNDPWKGLDGLKL